MLQHLRYECVLEWEPPSLPMSVDIMVQGMDARGGRHTIAIEVDGPHHYALNNVRTPATRERDVMLLLQDIHVRFRFNASAFGQRTTVR